MCHPCRLAIISHQDLVCLNRNLFMKIAKVINPVTFNTIFSWSFSVRHLLALFYYFLKTYDNSFLKVFIISQLIFIIFQSFCFFFLIGIHSMQGWTATMRHGVTRKRSTKRLEHTGNLFRKNLQLKNMLLLDLRSQGKGKHYIGREFQSPPVQGKKLLT